MLYAACVVKKGTSNCTWLLVNHEAFEPGKADSPIVEVKTDLKRMEEKIHKVVRGAGNNGGTIRIWARGQGVRKVHIKDVKGIEIISLDIGSSYTHFPTAVLHDGKIINWLVKN